MKPLAKKELEPFLKRFDNFIDAEIRSIEIVSPSVIKVTLATQDASRDYDWVTLSLEFGIIKEASLLDEQKLNLVDMSDGIDIVHNGIDFAFTVVNSTLRITSTYIKYDEKQF